VPKHGLELMFGLNHTIHKGKKSIIFVPLEHFPPPQNIPRTDLIQPNSKDGIRRTGPSPSEMDPTIHSVHNESWFSLRKNSFTYVHPSFVLST